MQQNVPFCKSNQLIVLQGNEGMREVSEALRSTGSASIKTFNICDNSILQIILLKLYVDSDKI
jgi:hypothetical protein